MGFRVQCIVVLLLAAPAAADTITVSPLGPLTSLQAGLDAASPGDTVLVLEGLYPGDFDVSTSSLTVRASGTVVLAGNGTFTGAKKCVFTGFSVNGSTTALHLDADSHGNTLSNLTVTCVGAPGVGIRVDGMRNTLSDCAVSSTDTAVELNGASNLATKVSVGPTVAGDGFDVGGSRQTLVSCTASGAGDDGFDLGGRGHSLSKCTASGATAAGFRVGGSASTLASCVGDGNAESGATIDGDGNVLSKCRFGAGGANAGPGVAFDGADGNLLVRCVVSGNAAAGIDLGSFGNAGNNRIERCLVANNGAEGILLSTSGTTDDNWIERNAVTGNGGTGIAVQSDDNVIVGNTVTGNLGGALVNSGSGNYLASNKTP